MKNFFNLFSHELRDVYSAEKQIVDMLPLLAKAANQPKLKEAFQAHLQETKEHVKRLETIARNHSVKLEGRECAVLQVIAKEAEKTMKANYPSEVMDAALISCAQRVEHYEIALYGTLKAFAKHLQFKEAEKLLNETSKEEGHADKLLSEIAMGTLFTTGINEKATRKSA